MPERFECTTLAKKALYKYSSFPFFQLPFSRLVCVNLGTYYACPRAESRREHVHGPGTRLSKNDTHIHGRVGYTHDQHGPGTRVSFLDTRVHGPWTRPPWPVNTARGHGLCVLNFSCLPLVRRKLLSTGACLNLPSASLDIFP